MRDEEIAILSPMVSIIIVNYNGEQVLRDCLQSVFGSAYKPLEVIVVDNASRDRSVALMRQEFPAVKIVVSSQNVGFAGGNNLGVAEATGEFIVLLNNDTVVDAAWIEPMLELAREPNVGAVSAKVITDGVPSEYYEMNGSINFLGYNIMRQFDDLSRVFYAGGAAVMFRRGIAEKPFLDEYFLYAEDLYFSWKLRLEGYDIRMAQRSVVRHKGSATTKRESSAFAAFYQERNRLLTCLLLYETPTLIRLLPYIVLDFLAKVAFSLVGKGKPFWGIARGYYWILKNIAWIKKQRDIIARARRIPDRAIMSLMSGHVIEGSSALANTINHLSRLYARIAGLPSNA